MDTTIRKAFIGMSLFMFIMSEASGTAPCWQQAHDAYGAQQWQEALRLYKQVDTKESACLYNIGNCSYKLGDFKQAFLCWKRALRGASSRDQQDIVHNINLLCTKLGYQSDAFSPPFWERLVLQFPLVMFQLLFLLMWYAWWFFLIWGARKRPFFFYGGMLLFLAILLSVGFLLQKKYSLHTYDRGIIINEKVVLFTGPHDQYDTLGQLSLYDEVQVKEMRSGWYKVTWGDQNGWIPSESITMI